MGRADRRHGGAEVWLASLQRGTVLRLFTALFLHADWAHRLGNLVFLLIFGLPAERAMGPWRFLLLFLVGGAVANVAAVLSIGTPDRVIIGASGAISAVIGAYLALFPTAKLGVVLPLGLFLEFVKAPASLLIGIWALLQVVFAYTGPGFRRGGLVARHRRLPVRRGVRAVRARRHRPPDAQATGDTEGRSEGSATATAVSTHSSLAPRSLHNPPIEASYLYATCVLLSLSTRLDDGKWAWCVTTSSLKWLGLR